MPPCPNYSRLYLIKCVIVILSNVTIQRSFVVMVRCCFVAMDKILIFQAFMERLGLWGEGTAFKSFEQLYETVKKKGLGKFLYSLTESLYY